MAEIEIEFCEDKKMKTKDGYDVYEGMVVSRSIDDIVAYEITRVHEDYVVYREMNWDGANCDFDRTNDGGLLFAEEIEQDYIYC